MDYDFTIDEVNTAISRLKGNQSAGDDLLIAELFLDAGNVLAPLLCKLLYFIYNTGAYPESWTHGNLVPAPKKGNYNNVDNYRGIMLTGIFKFFLYF